MHNVPIRRGRTLPDRPACPGCGTKANAIADVTRHVNTDGVAVITQACQYTRREERRRCGHPYAIVVEGQAASYVFAPRADPTFVALTRLLDERYGAAAQ